MLLCVHAVTTQASVNPHGTLRTLKGPCTGIRVTGMIHLRELTSHRMQTATRVATLFMQEGLSALTVSLGVRVSVHNGDQDGATSITEIRMEPRGLLFTKYAEDWAAC